MIAGEFVCFWNALSVQLAGAACEPFCKLPSETLGRVPSFINVTQLLPLVLATEGSGCTASWLWLCLQEYSFALLLKLLLWIHAEFMLNTEAVFFQPCCIQQLHMEGIMTIKFLMTALCLYVFYS